MVTYYGHVLWSRVIVSDGSTGGDHPVWRSQTGLTVSDGVSDSQTRRGEKYWIFVVKFAAQEAYLLECSK